MIAIGNCTNRELSAFVALVFDAITSALAEPGMVEVRRDVLIVTPMPPE